MSKQQLHGTFQSVFPFWDTLSPDDRRTVLTSTARLRLPKGTICHGQDPGFGLFYILSGSLRVHLVSDAGRDITLYRLDRGQVGCFNNGGLLPDICFSVNVESESATELYMVPNEVCVRIISCHPQVELYTCRLAVSRVSDAMWTLQQMLLYSFDKRLAIFLVDELSRSGGDTICYTHEQIARYVGSAREVVSRTLKQFANRGIVAVGRGGVRVLDKARLRALATAPDSAHSGAGA